MVEMTNLLLYKKAQTLDDCKHTVSNTISLLVEITTLLLYQEAQVLDVCKHTVNYTKKFIGWNDNLTYSPRGTNARWLQTHSKFNGWKTVLNTQYFNITKLFFAVLFKAILHQELGTVRYSTDAPQVRFWLNLLPAFVHPFVPLWILQRGSPLPSACFA